MPHEDSLTELSRKLIFLKAYQLASSEERLQLEIAQTLLEEAKSVLNETNDMSSMPLLLENLDKQVKAIIEKVESLIATTNEQLQSLHLDVSTRYLNFQFVPPSGLQGLTIPSLSSTDYTADLEKLKTLPLITKEEELLRFLLVSGSLILSFRSFLIISLWLIESRRSVSALSSTSRGPYKN